MDLQLRKIQFVQDFLRLNNEIIIDKLEKMLHFEKENLFSKMPEPMSFEEFNQIIDNAEEDYRNNRVMNVSELAKDIELWT